VEKAAPIRPAGLPAFRLSFLSAFPAHTSPFSTLNLQPSPKLVSLTDALLLSPHREVQEVWITRRSDGARGSGVQSDPYDGSTIYSAPIEITNLTTPDPTNKPLEAQATTNGAHGLLDDDVVIISGVDANGDWYDGWFLAYDTATDGPTKFKYKMRFKAAATSATGRVMQEPLSYRFDEVMNALAALNVPVTIHIAPGVFETRGHSGADEESYGFRLKSGFRIVGAGMGLTTLKLVGAAVPDRQYAVFLATTFMEGLEISDLTADCNVENQPNTDVLCAAVNVVGGGKHVRVRRVRAINWGTRFPDEYRENFVFFLASSPNYGDAIDCVLEECVAEQPSPNNHWNSSIFLVGGNGEEDWRGRKGNNYACAIRECYVDARNDYGPVVPIDTIEYQSGPPSIVEVVTRGPHRHVKPGNLIVQGVSNNAFNGIFEIHKVVDAITLQYKVAASPGTGSGGTIGGRVSSTAVTVSDPVPGSNPPLPGLQPITGQPKRFKLITTEPLHRTTNNNISLAGAWNKATNKLIPELNGTFPIVDYDPTKPNEVVFEVASDPGVSSSNLTGLNLTAKVGHIALTTDNGIAEGNRIFHCAGGGPYHDFWSVRSIVARENYYQDVSWGINMGLSGFSVSTWAWALRLKSLEYDDSELLCSTLALHSFAQYENSIAIAKVPPPSDAADTPNDVPSVRHHCLLPDDTVRVAAAGTDGAVYTGSFTVIDTPDPQTFTFEANGTATTPASAAQFLPRLRTVTDAADIRYDLRPLESIVVAGPVNGKYTVTATVRKLRRAGDADPEDDESRGLEKGEIVKICGAGAFPNRSTVLNGNFKITGVSTDGQSFDFELDTNPGTVNDPGYYGRIWKCDYWLFENNVVETGIRFLWKDFNTTRDSGLTIALGEHPPQYPTAQVVIRDNLFRHVNNGADPNKDVTNYPLPRAMQFGASPFNDAYGTEDALVQRNIVRLDAVAKVPTGARPTPIEFQPNKDAERGVQTFNNVSPDGVLIPSISDPQLAYEKRPELVSTIVAGIDEATCVAFLF
jgi:hypothetical protein